jgi:hypothetical protein
MVDASSITLWGVRSAQQKINRTTRSTPKAFNTHADNNADEILIYVHDAQPALKAWVLASTFNQFLER